MKFIHLSDLHLGKRINEYSMIKEQEYILEKIVEITENECADAVIIAGDVYDKNIPSAEAVMLLDTFLTELSKKNIPVFIISGNHDSAERISFGSDIMSIAGIYISQAFKGDIKHYSLNDSFGSVNIYLMPFIKPANVNGVYSDAETENYTDAMRYVIDRMNIDSSQRNILVAHQFITGASLSGSEVSAVGGLDNVDVSVFSDFDYTALGHIHSAQNICGNRVRYCGTPLKYSSDEADSVKSVTVVEIREKNNLTVKEIPLVPLHDMRKIKGKYMEITDRNNYIGTNTEDYVYIILTDEQDIPDVIEMLRVIYPNIMSVEYDNMRTRENQDIYFDKNNDVKSPLEIFQDLYRLQNNQELGIEEEKYLKSEIEKIWEEQ